MLGLLLATAKGCGAPMASTPNAAMRGSEQNAVRSVEFERRPAPVPIAVDRSSDAALRETVAEELGQEVAGQLPEVMREPPVPRDAGAHALVRSMLSGMGDRTRAADGVTRVCVGKLRNLSRASTSEFEQFLERFAEVLNRAGRDDEVMFLAQRSDDAQYDMLGTAYLITAEGFDLWELFITITPAGEGWTVWQPAGPVRILRQPRPGQQQVFPTR